MGHPKTSAAAAAVAASLLLGCLAPPPPAQAVTTEQLLFLEAWRAVDKAYVDKNFNGQSWFRIKDTYLKQEPMKNREQTYAAVAKLLATLDDPFTRFLEPQRLAALRSGTRGSVSGVGLEVTLDASKGAASELVVVAPNPAGPAAAAGIRAGDVISAVDGAATRGISLYEASDLLQGPEGSEVTLRVRPGGSGAERDVALTRTKVELVPVSHTTCTGVPAGALPSSATPSAGAGGRVGYLRVATFNSNTAPAARSALQALRSEGVDALVLDIRNNGGGLFPAGVLLAKMLINTGDIVLIADSAGVRDIYSADASAIDATTPLTVLVNRGTASASEVLAGALKDDGRAHIAGEPTFGKGLIQTVVDLSDGSGVAITVARYQTPAGVDINKVGITPDIRLAPDEVPSDAEGVCRLLQSGSVPKLFG